MGLFVGNNTEARSLLLRQQQEVLRQDLSANKTSVQQNSADQQSNSQAVQTNSQAQQGNASNIQTTNGNIQTTTGNIQSTEQSLGAANTQKSGVNTEISNLKAQLQSVQDDPDRAASIQNDLSAAEMSLSSIESEIQQLETQKQELEAQKGQQEQELAGLEQTGAQLKSEGQTLEQEGTTLQQTGAELAQKGADLEGQISSLDGEIASAEAAEQQAAADQQALDAEVASMNEQDFTDSKVNFGDTFDKIAARQLEILKQTNPNATMAEAKEMLYQLNPEVFDRSNPNSIRLNAEFTYAGNVDISNDPTVEENSANYKGLMAKKADAKDAVQADKNQKKEEDDAFKKALVKRIKENAGVFDAGTSELKGEKGEMPSGAILDGHYNKQLQNAVAYLDDDASLEDIAYAVRLASGGQRFASGESRGGTLSVNVGAEDLSKLQADMKALQKDPTNKELQASVNKRLNDFTLGTFTNKYIENGHEMNQFSAFIQDTMTDMVLFGGGDVANGVGAAMTFADAKHNGDSNLRAGLKATINTILPFGNTLHYNDVVDKICDTLGDGAKSFMKSLSNLNQQQQQHLQKALEGKSAAEQATILMGYGAFRR